MQDEHANKCPACFRRTLKADEHICGECNDDINRDPLPDPGQLKLVQRIRDSQPAPDPEEIGALPGSWERDDLHDVPVDLIIAPV